MKREDGDKSMRVFWAVGMEGWAATHKATHTHRRCRATFGEQTMRESKERKLRTGFTHTHTERVLEMENLFCLVLFSYGTFT